MSLKIAKPSDSFCSLFFNVPYKVRFDDLFHLRIMRAVKLTIKSFSSNTADRTEIDKALNAAISMKGKEYTTNYLESLYEVQIINNEHLDSLTQRVNNTRELESAF